MGHCFWTALCLAFLSSDVKLTHSVALWVDFLMPFISGGFSLKFQISPFARIFSLCLGTCFKKINVSFTHLNVSVQSALLLSSIALALPLLLLLFYDCYQQCYFNNYYHYIYSDYHHCYYKGQSFAIIINIIIVSFIIFTLIIINIIITDTSICQHFALE